MSDRRVRVVLDQAARAEVVREVIDTRRTLSEQAVFLAKIGLLAGDLDPTPPATGSGWNIRLDAEPEFWSAIDRARIVASRRRDKRSSAVTSAILRGVRVVRARPATDPLKSRRIASIAHLMIDP